MWYQPTGKKQEWRGFDEHCSLQPLASQLLSSNYHSTGLRVPILFIGDSTDRLIQQDVCDLGNMVGARVDPIGYLPDQTTLQVGFRDKGLLHVVIISLVACVHPWHACLVISLALQQLWYLHYLHAPCEALQPAEQCCIRWVRRQGLTMASSTCTCHQVMACL